MSLKNQNDKGNRAHVLYDIAVDVTVGKTDARDHHSWPRIFIFVAFHSYVIISDLFPFYIFHIGKSFSLFLIMHIFLEKLGTNQ